jgi:glutathione synthase/RimK-type ligase-like ATP-grasp enzyme
MGEKMLRVAVGHGDWHREFAEALDARIRMGACIDYDILDIDTHDWQARIAPYEVILWRGRYMDPTLATYYKEKIYFIERHLKKVVVPGYASVWHFESKVAQSYLLEAVGVPTPRTVTTVDFDDAQRCLDQETLPIVVKQSHGAASANVVLLRTRKEAEDWLRSVFFDQAWQRHTQSHAGRLSQFITGVRDPCFWLKVKQRLVGGDPQSVAYWQEFVADNPADLRITVIGDRHAIGFWRRNRPGDFRASGSGLLDYRTSVPEGAVRYCIQLNRQLGFDSMAYDLLFRDDDFLIVEISYGYLSKAVFDAPGHYVLEDDDRLRYEPGHMSAQELWVDWALRKAEAQRECG